MSLRRILLALLALPLGLAILVACGWFWLLHTQSGAHWVWSQVESVTGHALGASEISGDLGSGLIGKGIAFEGEGVHVSVG